MKRRSIKIQSFRRRVLEAIVLGICLPAVGFGADSVKLGDPSLTAGVPGSGALTVSDAKKYLDNPANHSVLSVELPEGLSAGKEAIYIPEDNPLTRAKVELGRQLYFDKRLSKNATVSCADCHSPSAGYGAHTQFGVGINGQLGGRNSPTSFNRILSKAQFWDGRAGSLEAQAVGPIANPIEMGNTHDGVVKFLAANEVYRVQFEKVFGAAPNIDNVGKAIAAFERTIVTGSSPYDAYEPLRKFQDAFAEQLEDIDDFKQDDPSNFAKFQELTKKSQFNPRSVFQHQVELLCLPRWSQLYRRAIPQSWGRHGGR
jgi:cytochrome c peroxidase